MLLSLHQLSCKVRLTAVQPLCVNLIMDTMRATALAIELPSNDSMVKPSVQGRSHKILLGGAEL